MRETLAPRLLPHAAASPRRREEFERAVEIEPVNDYAHFGLGLCLMRRGDRIGARRHLKLAVAMRPDQQDYRAALAASRDDRRDATARRTARRRAAISTAWSGGATSPIAPAADGIAELRAAGLRVAFVSNNSNSPVGDVVAKLGRMGVPATPADVVTERHGGGVAARAVARRRRARARRAPGPGCGRRSPTSGLVAVDDGPAEAVVVGFHRELRLRRPRPGVARGPRPARASSPPTSTPPIRSPAG